MKSVSNIPMEELNLFTKPPGQNAIERDILAEIRPTAVVEYFNPLKFEFTTGEDEYLKMSETELYLKIRLNLSARRGDSKTLVPTAPEHWDELSVANNLLHSLFESVVVTINGQPVTKNEQNYGYKAWLETVFGFNDEAKLGYLSSSLWSNNFIHDDDLDNKLAAKIAPSGPPYEYSDIELKGKLFTDLTYQPRAIIGGSKFYIELNWQKEDFILHFDKDPTDHLYVTIQVLAAQLETHRSKVSSAVVSAHKKSISSSPALYPIAHSEVKMFTIHPGTMDHYVDNAVTGSMPRRILVGLVNNKAANGDRKLNPYFFHHYNLSHFSAYVNGTPYPYKPFTPDWTSNNTLREYYSLVQAFNQDIPQSTFPFNRDEMKNGIALYAINFAPDLSDASAGHINKKQYGSLSLALKFKVPLPETVSLILYTEEDNIIAIDKNGQIGTDFHS